MMSFVLNVALAALLAQSASPAQPASTLQRGGRALAIQVALDRAGFSPGVIDGRMGSNTTRAVEAYRKEHGSDPSLPVEPLTTYTITDQDVSGPFAQTIPSDLMQQAELPSLTYTSVLESLAERYHSTPQLLKQLNPRASFSAGEQIRVPDVEPFVVPAPREETGTSGRGAPSAKSNSKEEATGAKPDLVVTVSKAAGSLTVHDGTGQQIFHAPVTTGSEHDPLPIGEWKITGVHHNPEFNYNPDLFWDADPSHAKAKLSPGPNNPVGVVWIDLSKEHYGIHGTPEPSTVGKTASHGCVRLTNWDALRLARLVTPGTRVVFAE
jgi:lipoprotein-anchoring transpeptidase ErfK/SrfK